MKHRKTVNVPAYTVVEIDKTTCDLCGSEIQQDDGCEIDAVTVKHRTGHTFPECGGGLAAEVDVCGECFKSKLTPWLRCQGAQVEYLEWDY